MTKNTLLEGLEVTNNRLTDLDLSQNPVLATLKCENNALYGLEVSENKKILSGMVTCWSPQSRTMEVPDPFDRFSY